jgi:hypothetical protein
VIVNKPDLQNFSDQSQFFYDTQNRCYILRTTSLLRRAYSLIPLAQDEAVNIKQNGGQLQKLYIPGQSSPIPVFSKPFNQYHEGFIAIKIPSDNRNFYYLCSENVQDLIQQEILKQENGIYQWTNPHDIKTRPSPDNEWKIQRNGVIILSSGNAGIYEMHKAEALSLLMNGTDVMMLNLRGYGGSEGTPDAEGSYIDLETAYQFVKYRCEGISDSKIVAWALCLSGGIAAHLAEKHPRINLFLNQTYASFWNILKEEIDKEITKYMKDHIFSSSEKSLLRNALKTTLSPLILAIIRLIAPNYKVKDRLTKIKGHICVMEASSDKLMTKEEGKQMREAIKDTEVLCDFVSIPGGHCTPWNQVVIYRNSNGELFSTNDYRWISINGKTFYFPFSQSSSINFNGQIYKIFPDCNNPENVKVQINNQPAVQILKQNHIEAHQHIEFAAIYHLKAEYIGVQHVKHFLSKANLGTSLI